MPENHFPVRILIITNSLNIGGAETFVMKIFRQLDKTKVVFDFIVNNPSQCFYLDEIMKLGGKVYFGYPKSLSLLKSFKRIYQIVRKNQYDIVFRLAVHHLSFLDLLASKFGGARKLVVRSTNTQAGGRLGSYLAFLFRPILNLIADIKLAPSKEAGEWLFGKSEKNKFHILNNGIDLNYFCFDESGRNKVRQEFGIKDKYVIGHIGRFNKQKNHDFLIEIFKKIKEHKKECMLMLVGEGELEKEIKEKVKKLGLSDSVVFTGLRTDIPQILSCFDMMIFPSFYEGLPNVIVEAQATGLPCLISLTITQEVKLTDLISFIPLEKSPDYWADYACSIKIYNKSRNKYKNTLIAKGYDIHNSVNNFLNLVFANNKR